MKRVLSFALVCVLLLTMLPAAVADTVIDGKEKRGIELKQVGLNEPEEDISPTTGRTLSEIEQPDGFAGLAVTGRYLPMLVQIDNDSGGVGYRAPWGALYADIVYESPLGKDGSTRISFLFSDLLPDSAGPIRSARVGHVWLREEWDAGFMFYGGQELDGSNIMEEFRKYGARAKGVLFDGTDGASKKWKKHYHRRSGLKSPHNVDGNVAAMSTLVPEDHAAPNHVFLFTDDPLTGDAAEEITIVWGKKCMDSKLIYDAETDTYSRYMIYPKNELRLWQDHDTEEAITFANVIIQYTKVTYNGSKWAPVTTHVGEGNADFFMNGQHVAGYWRREDMASRTVFYGPDGEEMPLQRGRTLIVIIPREKEVSYK